MNVQEAGSCLRRSALRALGGRVLLCRGERCRRFTVAHRSLRKDGIFLSDVCGQDEWFCSADCIEGVLAARFGASVRGRSYTMPRMPFRLVLLNDGVLSEAELQEALTYAEHKHIALWAALIVLGLVTEEQLAAAYARENGCALYALAPAPVAAGLRLPPQLTARSGAVTVHGARGISDRLVIGFTERVDRGLLAMAAQVLGRKAEACLITPRHLAMQMAMSEQGPVAAVPMATSQAAARLVTERARQMGAEQVRFGCSGGLLWVRSTMEPDALCAEHHDDVFMLAEGTVAQILNESNAGASNLTKKLRAL